MYWCQLQWPRRLWVINVGQPNEAQNKPGSKFLSSDHYIAFDVLQKKGPELTAESLLAVLEILYLIVLKNLVCEYIQFCVIIQNLLKLHNKISSTKRLCSVRDQVFHCLNTELIWIFVCKCKDFFCQKKKKEWRAHLSNTEPDSSAKEKKSIGCEPRPEHHRPEWIHSVGEDQHLAQAI